MDLIEARSILSPATGFIRRGGFDLTCNPYLGCTYGCGYCYAAYLPQNRRPVADWGRWLGAKRNAAELARRQAPKAAGKTVFMSSVTDPYQPAERSLMLTRGVLEALGPFAPRLVIQTRGPLVVRDIDVLAAFPRVRVNVSLPTDDDGVRRAFEPKAPPLDRRWEALSELKAAGLPVGVCVTPMLPVCDAGRFADRIAALQPDVVVCQDFHDAGGRFGADTAEAARQTLRDMGWGPDEYAGVVVALRQTGLTVHESEAGFYPPAAS